MKLLSVLVMAMMLSGCATAPAPDSSTELKLAEAKIACYNSQSNSNKNDDRLVDAKDVLLGKAIDGLVKAAGKNIDPCASILMNNDLQKVAMEENTKQIQAGVDFAKSAAGNIVVGVGVWKGLDVLPELFSNAGSTLSVAAGGDMALTDSIKTSTVGDLTGSKLEGIFSNPVKTKDSYNVVPAEEVVE